MIFENICSFLIFLVTKDTLYGIMNLLRILQKRGFILKKSISVLLCIILVLSAFSVVSYGADTVDLKIAVASDLHYNTPRDVIAGPENGVINDPIYFYANRRAAMEDESGFIIDEFLRQCTENDCDYVLISGDMVDNGRTKIEDHYAVAEKLRKFEEKTGKDVFVINGNHDFGVDCDGDMKLFKDVYNDFGYDKAIGTLDGTCSYTADLGEKYRLIALDSCDPSVSTEDGMSIERVNWVLDQAAIAKEQGRKPILMMHHNLLDHMPLQRIINRNFIVRFHYSTAELFADAGIKIVLTGHEHCSDATSYTTGLGNTIYDFATTSLTMYPLQYRYFTFTDDKITYEAKTVDKIDTDALTKTVKGYGNEQLDLMNSGLNEYSKGFLKAGVQFRLELSLSMEKLGISEDSIFYDLVNELVGKLIAILNQPLYGDGSVAEKALTYGIEIPETDCSTPWDLATDFVAAHYAGEEDKDLNSPEVKTLLKAVAFILREELPDADDNLIVNAANAAQAYLGVSGTDEQFTEDYSEKDPITPMEYFLLSVASPIINQFACDTDGVNDNNGELPGYGADELKTMENDLTGFFHDILLKIQYFFHYLIRIFDIIK